ncbi:MAG: diacylglycerol kinase family lipid kinase [Nitrospirae bacterium]|nr:diacylglycerol kinase family lipid kinase [Nitrospirota bacterium]
MKAPLVLIANPTAKRASGRKIQKAVDLLRSEGHEVEVFSTRKKGDAEDFARRAAMSGASFIIAAGGDGTFNEVINGIAKTDVRMAILPMGTTNVLAKELGVPEDVRGAIRVALTGEVHSVSLGSIAFTRGLSPAVRYFCLMAGIGFDGEAVFGVNATLKRCSGKGAYVMSGIKTLMRYSPELLTFVIDGKSVTGYGAIIGKASKYGGNFRVTPDASLMSPDLSICVMQGGKRMDIMRYAFGVLTGRHLRYRDIVCLRTDSVAVEGRARIQVDGDYLGTTPARVSVVPDSLRLVF